MSSPGNNPRWPTAPASSGGLGEWLANYALATVACLAIGCWVALEAAIHLFGTPTRSRVSPADAVTGMLHLPAHLADPRLAWPRAIRAQLPGPVGVYAAALLVALGSVALLVLVIVLSRRFGLWDPPGAGRSKREDSAARWARDRDLRPLVVTDRASGRVVLGRSGRRLLAAEAGLATPRRSAASACTSDPQRWCGLLRPVPGRARRVRPGRPSWGAVA